MRTKAKKQRKGDTEAKKKDEFKINILRNSDRSG